MALLNNIVEFRSDAFKMVTHFRRALPMRTDTIGPWLNCLAFLSWLSALTNSALVWLFHEQAPGVARPQTCAVVSRALFIAFAASHGYIVLRVAVRHLLERVMWIGSAEKARMDTTAQEVRKLYLQSVSRGRGRRGLGPLDPVPAPAPAPVPAASSSAATAAAAAETVSPSPSPPPPPSEFWEFDEGLAEIRKGIKDD